MSPARRHLLPALPLLLVLLTGPAESFADDTADEAELQFQLGAEAYQQGAYREALEHFHVSNRLVPNRNVVFNIARTYENLGQYPAAYRYYELALEGESATSARVNVEEALARITQQVAVVKVETSPPGATVFVNRRDLGPRGMAPRRLGLEGGHYLVIAELAGYEPASADVTVARGESTTVKLELRQILGTVRVRGTEGVAVRIDDPASAIVCVTPCSASVAPGRHRVILSRPGFHGAELVVDVEAERATTVSPQLKFHTGTVVVSSDEPGALIEVDGEPRGFTPSVVTLPIGDHALRVSHPGFDPVERVVQVERGTESQVAVALTPVERVQAASRTAEDSARAPSSVSIIPRSELRAFAYPTLAEALRGTRGIYQWDDRAYVSLGVRGLARLGGYGSRVLVLQDGMPTNDNWVGSSYVGYDAMSDLGDVERIELVRGPGSALYGTGAFSGVINVVTRQEEDPSVEGAIATELDGVARARVRANAPLGERGSFWASASTARDAGREFYFHEYADVEPPNAAPGHAVDVDGFEAGTTRGTVSWEWLRLRWFLHQHKKSLPAHFDTLFGDDGTWQRDTRGILELAAEPEIAPHTTLASRVYLNHYDFRGEYQREPVDGGLQIDRFLGRWVGMEHRLLYEPSEAFRLTFGGEVQSHYLVEEQGWDETGIYLDHTGNENKDYRVGASYAIVDADLVDGLRVSAGARLDSYSTWGSTVNPRTAVILRPYAAGNSKILFGRAFRAPSVYELYYNDDGYTQIPPPTPLRPETIYTGELEHAHRFSPTLSLTGSVHSSYISNLIDTAGAGSEADPVYYRNIDVPLVTGGAEVLLRRDWRRGFMGLVGYSLTGARFLEDASTEALLALHRDPESRHVSNIPTHAATFKGAAPLFGKRLMLASRLTVESGRWDRYESVGEAAQRRTDPYALWDVVLTGREESFGLDYAVGVYNLFDWQYELPVSDEQTIRTIAQRGRTLLASLAISL